MTIKVTPEQAADLITNHKDGTFFGVTFIKRTNGEIRHMTCRRGVKKYTKGVGLKYDPKAKNLLGVWEANTDRPPEQCYRSISLENLLEVRLGGETYTVEHTTITE